MKSLSHTLKAFALAALGGSARAAAADADPPMFSFNGFGTAGVVHSSDNKADFVSNPAQPKGAGFTDSWSATPDTKLGIQLQVALPDQLSAVVQVMSQYQYDGTFRPDLEWANLKYLSHSGPQHSSWSNRNSDVHGFRLLEHWLCAALCPHSS